MSSPGVQHIDCGRKDELCEPFRREVDDVNNDEYNEKPMENGVASLPNLSTIEEEPSVLHDVSPLRQTSQEPSSSHETAKSPDEEPSVLHDDSPLRKTSQEQSSSHETAKSPEEEPSMENGVASLPNLSTIEGEPPVLHDDSPLRQTSQEPSKLKDKKKNHQWKMVWPA